jgi:choline monooxygenase
MNAPHHPIPATPSAPLETSEAAGYGDPAQWRAERRGVFARTWQFLGHESALAEPGAWIAETLAGYPVVVVRDDAGALRGFHNVCRHRAGPLTDGPSGRCDGALVCRYHGWRYAYDGRLRLARDFGPAAGFDPRDFSLFPIQVQTWRGLVFVRLDGADDPLADWVAPLEARVAGADWSGLQVALIRHHPLACNWKAYVENYLEGYHVPNLHPSLDAEIDSAAYRVEMDGYVALHEAPLRKPEAVYGGLWAWLWPNLGVNVYGEADGLMIERISPLGPSATRLDYVYLTPGGKPVSEETLAMSDAVLAEDRWIVERVQVNLDAGVYRTGRLSPRHELAVGAFQDLISEALSPDGAGGE